MKKSTSHILEAEKWGEKRASRGLDDTNEKNIRILCEKLCMVEKTECGRSFVMRTLEGIFEKNGETE